MSLTRGVKSPKDRMREHAVSVRNKTLTAMVRAGPFYWDELRIRRGTPKRLCATHHVEDRCWRMENL